MSGFGIPIQSDNILVMRRADGHVVYSGPNKPLPKLHGGGTFWVHRKVYNEGHDTFHEYVFPEVIFDEDGKPQEVA